MIFNNRRDKMAGKSYGELMKHVALKGLIASVLGGVILWIIAQLTGQLYATIGLESIVGGVLALLTLGYVAIKTDVDVLTFFEFIMVVVAVGVYSTVISMLYPPVAEFLLTLASLSNITAIAWFLVAIGFAFGIVDHFTK